MTSSIAAIGYSNVPVESWPVTEDMQFPLGDLYSYTKHAQEDIARLFAYRNAISTIALRPPAFMPIPALDTGFALTGNFAVVDDIAAAHMAAAVPGEIPAWSERFASDPRFVKKMEVTVSAGHLPTDVHVNHLFAYQP